MITDKQRQRDYEYEADYQSKSRYTTEQWTNILNSGQLDENNISLLKQIYSSFNHAATLLQLSFESNRTQEDLLSQLNAAGQLLGEANSMNPEVDYEGNEYWWYLFFWGKNTNAKTLELKMHPELTEAIGALYPELEEAYYAFMSDVERSLQIRYSQEDAVWIAAAVLLYEKYYCNPGISSDDILLMQYEVQTRSQKVYGQDVNANTITQICNADERGHRFNYLRDIYKYYRVSFPGEFEGERERPDPEEVDYNAYIYSILGYMKLTKLTDFIEHEYAHLVDESYVELTNANGFVRMAAYLSRQGGTVFSPDDTSDKAISLRADGEDAAETFHKISEAILKEYPNFIYASKADWYLPESGVIAGILQDSLYIPSYADVLKVVLISYFGKTRIGDLVHLLSGRDGEKKSFSKKEISKKVSEEAFEKLGAGVKAFVCEENFQGFQKALKKAGYSCSRLLYSQSVLNYCYAMYLLMYRQGIGEKERESLLSKWMTMAMITGHYQSGGESTVQKDYANAQEEGFASYLAQIEELKLTDEFYNNILPEKFTSTTARTAPFLAYVATQCARGVHSLYSDVTIEELYKNKTESYQILPKAYLAKCGYKTREIYGQVANLTYISKETKDIIRKKSPVDYKESLEKAIGIEKIRTSLKENGLAETVFTANETDVIQILADRRRQMASEIRDFYKTL